MAAPPNRKRDYESSQAGRHANTEPLPVCGIRGEVGTCRGHAHDLHRSNGKGTRLARLETVLAAPECDPTRLLWSGMRSNKLVSSAQLPTEGQGFRPGGSKPLTVKA
jgi:hypothetical protein